MDLDDFFEIQEFRKYRKRSREEGFLDFEWNEKFNNYLIRVMRQNLGYVLLKELDGCFEGEGDMRDWFYTKVDGSLSRPYDYCRMEKRKEMREIIAGLKRQT